MQANKPQAWLIYNYNFIEYREKERPIRKALMLTRIGQLTDYYHKVIVPLEMHEANINNNLVDPILDIDATTYFATVSKNSDL